MTRRTLLSPSRDECCQSTSHKQQRGGLGDRNRRVVDWRNDRMERISGIPGIPGISRVARVAGVTRVAGVAGIMRIVRPSSWRHPVEWRGLASCDREQGTALKRARQRVSRIQAIPESHQPCRSTSPHAVAVEVV